MLTINNTNNSGTNSGTYNTNVLETSGSGNNTDLSSQLYITSYNTLKVHTTFTPSSPVLASGSAISLTFHNAGVTGDNNNNWNLNVYNSESTQVANIRADWWDGPNEGGSNAGFTYPYTYSDDGGNTLGTIVWSSFQTNMTNANVELNLSYISGTLYVTGTMTNGNNVYYVNYKKTGLNGDLSYSLVGNGGATLSNIVTASTTPVTTPAAHPTKISAGTIGATGYSTFTSTLYPLDLSAITGAQAFYAKTVDTANSKVLFESTDASVPAGEGLLLKGTAGDAITIKIADEGTAISGNKLVGCTVGTTLNSNSNYYVLVSNNGTAEFQCLDQQGATIPAGKAYLNAAAAGARLSIVFNDATGISAVENVKGQADSYYNLNGQRTVAPLKGLYIVNGKKVIIK